MNFAAIRAAVRARALYFGLLVAVLVACAAMVGTDTWRTWERRGETIKNDKVETANLTRSLAQHAHDVVQSVDSAIVALREVAEMEGVNAKTFGRLDHFMQTQTTALPVLHAIMVFDATGQYVADSMSTHHPSLNGSDRPYFKYHASNPDRGVRLGEPVHSKIDGAWILTVSRRINAPDGSFAGVVVGTISVDALQAFYATFDVGNQGAIALISDQGTLDARKPADNTLVGTSLAKGQLFTAVQHSGATGSFEYVSVLDGVTRLGSYQRVDGFPLLIVASHGLDEVLTPWRHAAIFHLTVSSVIACCFAILGFLLSRQVKRRLVVEAALKVNERQYRLLAENSADLVIQLDRDLRRTYVSPNSMALLDYDPRDLITRAHKDIISTEDWPALSTSLAVANPDESITPVSHRIKKWGGAYLWVETAGRRLADGGYILTVRDITQRRAADALLQESNDQLQRLVMVDPLTGVGNKQSFDLFLAREYVRVERSGMPLSLLIVDLDHSTLFNDRFGPIAVDACMRRLATEIGGCLTHGSDSVSRIGDDEFAVLLPLADEQEAAAMAEKICETARTLHERTIGDAAARRVSVSIGVATVWPRSQAIGPQDFVYATDEALLHVKRKGRDGWHASTTIADFKPAIVVQEEKAETQDGEHPKAVSLDNGGHQPEDLIRPAA